MPKKIKFESFKYCFLIAAQTVNPLIPLGVGKPWREFLLSLRFDYKGDVVAVGWEAGIPGIMEFRLDEARFYLRGDSDTYAQRQRTAGMLETEDPIRRANYAHFIDVVMKVAEAAGYAEQARMGESSERLAAERAFHDEWAGGVDVSAIDVRSMNEACTAPEMRYITARLGDLRGKTLLDVGCGLGEASVYFALRGAEVTASDLSPGMLDATCRLASANGVTVNPHLAAAEDMQLPPDVQFDVIYAGNLLHHVDIDATLARLVPHLKPDGVLVTWDPLAYNPVINVYRAKATSVRTADEHPLKWSDIKLFRKYFGDVETRYFWLTTLAIFVIMAVLQRRDPNRERYWKSVVQESEKWRPLYMPLEGLDRVLLFALPPLRLLCWNVVVIARKPRIRR
jgi:2-polyprenyl-3-methyl-5-hydroxy-6-metoxy-1,4-benzoquinol methylase